MSRTDTTLKLIHLASAQELKFRVRVRRYEQNVKPTFAKTQVYARMDPIFTYQNTVRDFVLDCHTIVQTKDDADDDDVTVRQKISKLFKFMYPLYEVETAGTIKTHTLKGPPILSLEAPGILTAGDSGALIFVPETFSLTSGLADSEKIQYVSGPEDLRFLAPADGYGFTLGGTILHQNAPPGWKRGTNRIVFTKKKFPLGVD